MRRAVARARARNILAGGCAVLAFWAGARNAPAQGRGWLQGPTVGYMQDPGTGPSTTLRYYSNDLRSLSQRNVGPDSGILSVSMSPSGYSVPTGRALSRDRASPLAFAPSSPLGVSRRIDTGLNVESDFRIAASPVPPPRPVQEAPSPLAKAGLVPETVSGGIEDVAAPGMGAVLSRMGSTALGAAQAYLQAVEAASASRLTDRTKPITSLVPEQAGMYRDRMAKGDEAFRRGDYLTAYDEFQIANDVQPEDAESVLCMFHAQFALSRYSYGKAAVLLERALACLPELPLANLRPRGFFGDPGQFAQRLVSLEDYVAKHGDDREAQLVLAYFRWFGEARDAAATRQALRQAFRSAVRSGDRAAAEAARTFWDGLGAAGGGAGPLRIEDVRAPSTAESGGDGSSPGRRRGAAPTPSSAPADPGR